MGPRVSRAQFVKHWLTEKCHIPTFQKIRKENCSQLGPVRPAQEGDSSSVLVFQLAILAFARRPQPEASTSQPNRYTDTEILYSILSSICARLECGLGH